MKKNWLKKTEEGLQSGENQSVEGSCKPWKEGAVHCVLSCKDVHKYKEQKASITFIEIDIIISAKILFMEWQRGIIIGIKGRRDEIIMLSRQKLEESCR